MTGPSSPKPNNNGHRYIVTMAVVIKDQELDSSKRWSPENFSQVRILSLAALSHEITFPMDKEGSIVEMAMFPAAFDPAAIEACFDLYGFAS